MKMKRDNSKRSQWKENMFCSPENYPSGRPCYIYSVFWKGLLFVCCDLLHYPGQLSLAIPLWVGAMSTSESCDIDRHTARCTSPVSVVWQCKLVPGWGLMKWGSAPLYGPYGSGRTTFFTICYVNCVLSWPLGDILSLSITCGRMLDLRI